MKSKAIIGSLAGLLVLVALAATALWSVGWTGALSERTLGSGDSVTMESGLSFTVPAGHEGLYTKYLWVPSWLPIGDGAGGLHRSEDLTIRGSDLPDGSFVVALTFYANGQLPTKRPVVATGRDVTVSMDSTASTAVLVKTHIAGRRDGYVLVKVVQGQQLSSLHAEWSKLNVAGVNLP